MTFFMTFFRMFFKHFNVFCKTKKTLAIDQSKKLGYGRERAFNITLLYGAKDILMC